MTEKERDRITYLILRKISSTIVEEETKELDEWGRQHPDHQQLINDLMDDEILMKELMVYHSQDPLPGWNRLVEAFPELKNGTGT